jgi:hypothetical protein
MPLYFTHGKSRGEIGILSIYMGVNINSGSYDGYCRLFILASKPYVMIYILNMKFNL